MLKGIQFSTKLVCDTLFHEKFCKYDHNNDCNSVHRAGKMASQGRQRSEGGLVAKLYLLTQVLFICQKWVYFLLLDYYMNIVHFYVLYSILLMLT